MTTTLCVVHHSITGTTSKLASAVAAGLSSVVGCLVKVHAIEGADIVDGRFRKDAAARDVPCL